MEVDDEFGDLYTDVFRPFQDKPQEIARPIDPKVEDKLHGASESKTSVGFNLKLNSEKTVSLGGFDLNLEPLSKIGDSGGSNFQASGGFRKGEGGKGDEEDALGKKNADILSVEDGKFGKNRVSGNLMEQGVTLGGEHEIPGLSRKLENSNYDDDLESDESEDDLEIVLNENGVGSTGIEMMKGMNEDDEEGDPLVIVADNGDYQQMMNSNQEWKVEEAGPGVDAERKNLGYAAKADGGGAAIPAVVAPKTGFNNHMYHHPLHSQFKYVRPGTAPVTGGDFQVRPPITAPPVAGRGRGDWRPIGIRGAAPIQKSYYGSPVPVPVAGRGYGSGLDFTLPSHRTIFEVDIDGFEEKPWKFPGIDVSDFFNFGLNEESWKEYCKQLEQLRLETTMQSKIRVYESSRAEQDYDPDLPPELAAAVGNSGIRSENVNTGKVEASSSEVAVAWPVGRPIPVETGSGDRAPSTDTRRLRLHDSDTIIEIICQSIEDENENENDVDDDEPLERSMNPSSSRKLDDLTITTHKKPSDHNDDGRKVDQNESLDGDDNAENPPSSQVIESEADPATAVEHEVYESEADDDGHQMEKERRALDPTTSDVQSDERLVSKKRARSRMEHGSQHSDQDQDSKAATSAENGRVRSGNSRDNRKFGENVEEEVMQDRRGTHSRSQRRHAGSEYHGPTRSQREKEGLERQYAGAKGREGSLSRRRDEPSIPWPRQTRGDNFDSRKENEISEGSRRRRDDDLHGRTVVEDARKRVHGDDISSRGRSSARDRERGGRDENYQPRNLLEKDSWGRADYDQDIGLRQRQWEGDSRNRGDVMNDFNEKRKKDGRAYASWEQGEKAGHVLDYREGSRGKSERNDVKGEQAKSRDDVLHHGRKREERSVQKERDERHRGREVNKSKESLEENFSRRDRDTKHTDMRSGRTEEDKSRASHSQRKDDYKESGRDDSLKDAGRHDDQVKRRDRSEGERVSQSRAHEDAQIRTNQASRGEKRSRHERTHTRDDTGGNHTSEAEKKQEHQKDSRRISKEPEGGEHNSTSKGNRDEMIHNGDKKDGDKSGKASSEDENGSKRGRSKLERWTSQKERDFGAASAQPTLKRSKIRDTTNNAATSLNERPPLELREKSQPSANDKEPKGETNATAAKLKMDDKHLDTVEKLKKRSERFKLPMPGEKDPAATTKKLDSDILPSDTTETPKDLDVKPERPPRKRRWTGN